MCAVPGDTVEAVGHEAAGLRTGYSPVRDNSNTWNSYRTTDSTHRGRADGTRSRGHHRILFLRAKTVVFTNVRQEMHNVRRSRTAGRSHTERHVCSRPLDMR